MIKFLIYGKRFKQYSIQIPELSKWSRWKSTPDEAIKSPLYNMVEETPTMSFYTNIPKDDPIEVIKVYVDDKPYTLTEFKDQFPEYFI